METTPITTTEAGIGFVIQVTDFRRGDGYLHSIKKAKNGRVTYRVTPDLATAHRFADEALALKWAAKMGREADVDSVEVAR